jgi:hypothetical protein
VTDTPIIVAGPTSVTIATRATVVVEDREVAWAAAKEKIRTRPDMGWLVGRYLATDVANENGHIFRLADIEAAHKRIVHTPLNMLHRSTHVIGSYVAAELVLPSTDESAILKRVADQVSGAAVETAHVEALAAVWRYVFPEEWATIRAANEEGTLFYSMEAVPTSVTCPTCTTTCAYAGPASDSYCEHMATAGGPKILDDPLFVGGAIVVPPARPGWRNADITELATAEQAEEVYDQLTEHGLDPAWAEQLMAQLLNGAFAGVDADAAARLLDAFGLDARAFPAEMRKKMSKKGQAMPDGSFPIPDKDALRRAINSLGRAKNQDAVRRHIIKRARALGLTEMLPDAWNVKS